MSDAQLQIRGDIQIQLAKVGYELRRIQKALENVTLDRPPDELERGVLDHTSETLKGVRLAQDHAERVGFYLEELLDDDKSDARINC